MTSIVHTAPWPREAARDEVHVAVTELVCTEVFFSVQEDTQEVLSNFLWFVEEAAEDGLR